MDNTNDGNPFAISDLWKTSSLVDIETNTRSSTTEPWCLLWEDWDLGLQHDGNQLLEKIECPELLLPDLYNFKYGPVQPLETLESISSSSIHGSDDGLQDDPWAVSNVSSLEQRSELKTWEAYYDKKLKEPKTVYLSEGGPGVFDAALKLRESSNDAARQGIQTSTILKVGGFYEIRLKLNAKWLKGLGQLGLGRESFLFKFDQSQGNFEQVTSGERMSGFSTESFASLIAVFKRYGDMTKRIQKFVDMIYTSNDSCSTGVALANASSIILSALHTQSGDRSLSAVSALQLQSVFQTHGLILAYIDEIVERIGSARSDENLLSELYSFLQDHQNSGTDIQNVGFELLAYVSKPWLESISRLLGIDQNIAFDDGDNLRYISLIGDESGRNGGASDIQGSGPLIQLNSIPSFIVEADAVALAETSRSVRLLREHRPQHPLVRSKELYSVNRCTLEWQFTWRDAERIAIQAKEYERSISETIRDFHTLNSSEEPSFVSMERSQPKDFELSVFPKETIEAQIATSISEIEMPATWTPSRMNPLEQAVARCIDFRETAVDTQFDPVLSLVPQISFNPIISAQSRLVNHACLRLLFKEHKIRLHFSAQYCYSLFGDAIFAARLSHALFDPEMQSAERRKGHSRSGVSGLRLGSRDTWPPACSELRLALMGILTDSFWYTDHTDISTSPNIELPGGLSFAVREMSESDLERCMDPDSIEALDFLRLQYTPPALLDVIFTPSSLAKYDSLFKLLLRGTRMLYAVNQFFRDTADRRLHQHRIEIIIRKFKWEAHHFVSTIYSYFSDGINACWDIFSQRLSEIEGQLDKYDSQHHEGLHGLRDFHEKVLDRMMFAVFLRKRQEQVMRLVEEIFGIILIFARLLRNRHEGNLEDTRIEDAYRRYAKKVKVFVSICRGLSQKRGPGGLSKMEDVSGYNEFRQEDRKEDGGNTIGQLLLKLDMNGYHAKSIKH